MLRYIILFSVISSCYSGFRMVGEYNEIIFSQRWPAAAVLQQKNKLILNGSHSDTIHTYLSNHATILEELKWVIHGYWAIRSGSHTIRECRDYDGTSLVLNADSLEDYFKSKLRKRWPAFKNEETEDDLWIQQYNWFGSCISSIPLYYFQDAIRILKARNIGDILAESRIVPDDNYSWMFLTNSIDHILSKHACVICLPDQDDEEKQYLLEVQICFNSGRQLIDCRCPVPDYCDRQKNVIYQSSIQTY